MILVWLNLILVLSSKNKELKNNNLFFLFICVIFFLLIKSEGRLFLVLRLSGMFLEGLLFNVWRNKC